MTGRPGKKPGALRVAGDPEIAGGFRGYLIEFIDWTAARQYSAMTVKARRIEMGYFIDWCEERGIRKPDEVTRGILERYRQHIFQYHRKTDGAPLSHQTQAKRLISVRAFFQWLARQHHLLYNPASDGLRAGFAIHWRAIDSPDARAAAAFLAILQGMKTLQTTQGHRKVRVRSLFSTPAARQRGLLAALVLGVDEPNGPLGPLGRIGRRHEFAQRVEDLLELGRSRGQVLRVASMRLAPDATTVLKFRRLLEDNKLTQALFERINKHLTDKGLLMRQGAMVDATIIAAPGAGATATCRARPSIPPPASCGRTSMARRAATSSTSPCLAETMAGRSSPTAATTASAPRSAKAPSAPMWWHR